MSPMLLLLAYVAVGQPDAGFSPEGQAFIREMSAAVQAVRDRQAALPPPKDDAERLLRMGELDQSARLIVGKFDFSRIPETERDRVRDIGVAPMEAADAENQAALMRMLPPEGWFIRSRYGDKASDAAFHIVQHGGADMQRRFLPKLQELAKAGEVEGQQVAMMYDRIAISEGRPQRYGTQFRCDGGKYRPYPLEDAARVEALREEAGVGWTFAKNLEVITSGPACPQTRSPPPPGMKLD